MGIKIADADTGIFVDIESGEPFVIIDHDTGEFVTVSGGMSWDNVSGKPEFYTKDEVDELIINTAPSPTGSFVLSGGHVVWEGNLDFRVSAADYYINSTQYTSTEQTITLDTADPTNPRIDVIALDNTGTVVKITGTPAASPSRPDIDPETQLHLTFVLVEAGATTPTGVSSNILYQENLGSGSGEWDVTDSGATINPDSTADPKSGSKSIEFTNAANTNWVLFTGGASLNLANYEQLVLYIKNKSAWANQKSLRLSWILNGVTQGNFISIDNGLYGFNHSNTSDYQQIAIPLSSFVIPVSQVVDELLIEVRGSGGNLGLYIDDVMLQTGVPQEAIGMTIEEADARYRKLVDDIISMQFVIDGGGSTILTGVKLSIRFYSPYRIISWSLGAPLETGSITIDLWKDVHASYPPTDADSITNGHELAISNGQSAEDTDLSDWTSVDIVTGDWVVFNVDSVTSHTLVTVALKLQRL